MAEVVSDSEPSPLEVLRTGLNMVAALAESDATSGTGIPPGRHSGQESVQELSAADGMAAWLRSCHTYTIAHLF